MRRGPPPKSRPASSFASTSISEMIAYLARQGYGLADRPPSGTKLQLRKTSNIATGGKLRDVSAHIHPDNIAMAETIARNFWLDGAGIDFVTPDISVSWREIPCAVVDVNSPPGMTSDFLAEKALGEKFPPGENGRIPCVLIVAGDDALQSTVAERFAANGFEVGRTDGKATYLDRNRRHMGVADLPLRVMSLCSILPAKPSLSAPPLPRLERHGIPHVRFDLALLAIPKEVPMAIRQLIATHAKSIMDLGPETCSSLSTPCALRPVQALCRQASLGLGETEARIAEENRLANVDLRHIGKAVSLRRERF